MRKHKIILMAALLISLGILFSFMRGAKFMNQVQPSSFAAVTAVMSGKLSLPLAPENISTIPLYHIHRNLWDTIVTEHGEPGIARILETSDYGKKIHFEILSNSRFSNGRVVKTADVLFSLKRLMKKQPGGHFNLKSMIEKIEEISDTRFNLQLKMPIASFLYALSTPEMGVVPSEACDSDGNLTNLGVTSGPYVVAGQVDTGKIVLAKNQFFTRHDLKSPDKVTIFLRATTEEMVDAAKQYQVDFIEGYNSTGTDAVQKLRADNSFAMKLTKPSYSAFLVINNRRLSALQRLGLANLVKKDFTHFYNINAELEQRSFEVLPPNTFGSLEAQSYAVVKENGVLPRKLKLGALNPHMTLSKAIVELFTNAGIELDVNVWNGENTENYDVLLYGQGMNADYPEIEFHLNMVSPYAFISAHEDEKNMILSALGSNDRKVRQGLIQKIGSALLQDNRVIPLVVRSYVHLIRNDRISVDQITNYDGDIPFWKMQVR